MNLKKPQYPSFSSLLLATLLFMLSNCNYIDDTATNNNTTLRGKNTQLNISPGPLKVTDDLTLSEHVTVIKTVNYETARLPARRSALPTLNSNVLQ